MGLSLFSAIVGLVLVIASLVTLVLRRGRKIALLSFITGLLLIFVPYLFIYIFLD